MATKRKHSDVSEDTDAYREKRDRNNQAVKRSRDKTKQKTEETQRRVRSLHVENEVMEQKIKKLNIDLGYLKKLFLNSANAKKSSGSTLDPEISKLLETIDDDDDEEDGDDDKDTIINSTIKSNKQ